MRRFFKPLAEMITAGRVAEISTAVIVIIYFIWFFGLFFGAGKLDWWSSTIMISVLAYFVIILINSLISEIIKNRR